MTAGFVYGRIGKYANLLLAQAKLVAGLPLDDPAAFAEAVLKLM